ncbi:warA, partial [Symbiodinium sp. KB8]
MVQLLHQYRADLNTAVILASTLGRTKILVALLQLRADPDVCNISGDTPLLLALQNNQLAVASALCQHRANV